MTAWHSTIIGDVPHWLMHPLPPPLRRLTPAPPSRPSPPAQPLFQQQRQQQRRPFIAVDVPNGNVDRALRTLSRKLREENYMAVAQAQAVYVKPSERRKLAASESAKRISKQQFKCVAAAELGWARGVREGGAGRGRSGCAMLLQSTRCTVPGA